MPGKPPLRNPILVALNIQYEFLRILRALAIDFKFVAPGLESRVFPAIEVDMEVAAPSLEKTLWRGSGPSHTMGIQPVGCQFFGGTGFLSVR